MLSSVVLLRSDVELIRHRKREGTLVPVHDSNMICCLLNPIISDLALQLHHPGDAAAANSVIMVD